MPGTTPGPFRLYNTLSRQVEEFNPLIPGQITMYACGMTVYDDAHIGHARAFVIFDAFVRYRRHRGWNVNFIRNFTDVDDKIIRRANERGEEPIALAERYITRLREDTQALGLEVPTAEPRVSESIPEIVAMIGRLVEAGHAYAAEGSVWFSVPSFPDYGSLSNQKVDELRSEDPGGGKRHSADFALWKAVKPGEPSWDSPWGPGRPGWHIECSAMAAKALGPTIDIHAGGMDLLFPHHENEVAQSVCANHAPYARYWMHNGLLTMASGQKMGKSLGNAINIRELLHAYPAEALRLYYLQAHYRSPLPFNEEALPEALSMLARLYEAREVAESMKGTERPEVVAESLGADALKVLELGRGFIKKLYDTLDEDFNTAQALGDAFELARAINRMSNHKRAKKRGGPVVAPALEAFDRFASALGVMQLTSDAFAEEVRSKRLPSLGLTEADVDKMLTDRAEARAAKDWARADTLRGELEAKRIVVMDRGGETVWRIRL